MMELSYLGVVLLGLQPMVTVVQGQGFGLHFWMLIVGVCLNGGIVFFKADVSQYRRNSFHENVARGKNYSQFGIDYNATDECIDFQGWYFHFEVDLGRKYPVYNISFWINSPEMDYFHISVDYQYCVSGSFDPANVGNISVACSSVIYGQGVLIYFSSFRHVRICELEILVCQAGWYGPECDQACSNLCMDNTCDPQWGVCALNGSGCSPGSYGDQCDKECQFKNCSRNMCDQTTGWCLACDGSYAGDNCTACSPGWYGDRCDKECRSQMCLLDMCDQTTGLCLACKGGYAGDTCTVCLPGWYGDRCDIKCQSQSCLLDNSNKTGWSVACNRAVLNGTVLNDDVESAERQSIYAIVGAIFSVGLLLIIAVVATIRWLHRSKERKQESAAMPSSNFSDGSAHSNYYSLISDDHELRPLLNINERPLPREHTSVGRTLANQASNVHMSTNNPDAESQYDSISVFSTSSSGSLLSSVYPTDRSRYLHPIFNPIYSDRLKGITST